jgi:hypothetical protein
MLIKLNKNQLENLVFKVIKNANVRVIITVGSSHKIFKINNKLKLKNKKLK